MYLVTINEIKRLYDNYKNETDTEKEEFAELYFLLAVAYFKREAKKGSKCIATYCPNFCKKEFLNLIENEGFNYQENRGRVWISFFPFEILENGGFYFEED